MQCVHKNHEYFPLSDSSEMKSAVEQYWNFSNLKIEINSNVTNLETKIIEMKRRIQDLNAGETERSTIIKL